MPYKSKSGLAGDATDALATKGNFYIEIFHINSRKTVRFKAFMKDYNDVHNVTYDDQNFIGQSEPVKKWKSTVRQIDLSFAVVASGIAEAKQNLSKVSLMTNMLYPEQQKDGDGIITKVGGSPIFKVRFLNLIGAPGVPWGEAWQTGLQGYISNFLYRVDLENGVSLHIPSLREGGRKIPGLKKSAKNNPHHVYPQEINVSFTFFPVYEKSPGWRVEGDRVIFNVNNQDITNYPYFEDTKAGESNVTPGRRGAHEASKETAAQAAAMGPPIAAAGGDPKDSAGENKEKVKQNEQLKGRLDGETQAHREQRSADLVSKVLRSEKLFPASERDSLPPGVGRPPSTVIDALDSAMVTKNKGLKAPR